MTDKTIANIGKVGGDYFSLKYLRSSDKKLDFYLEQFDVNDYWIYKKTNKQYEVTIDDLYNFKYLGYIFFNKNKYNNKIIDKTLKLKEEKIGNHAFQFLDKPLPPLEIIEKIKIL